MIVFVTIAPRRDVPATCFATQKRQVVLSPRDRCGIQLRSFPTGKLTLHLYLVLTLISSLVDFSTCSATLMRTRMATLLQPLDHFHMLVPFRYRPSNRNSSICGQVSIYDYFKLKSPWELVEDPHDEFASRSPYKLT